MALLTPDQAKAVRALHRRAAGQHERAAEAVAARNRAYAELERAGVPRSEIASALGLTPERIRQMIASANGVPR